MFFGLPTEIWILIGLGLLVFAFLMSSLARLYRKAGPHEALVVYGFRGKRVITDHGTIVLPMIENCHDLSLELMSFDVAPRLVLREKEFPQARVLDQPGPLLQQLLVWRGPAGSPCRGQLQRWPRRHRA